MAKLSISRAWEESQRVLAHDGRLLASVALALIVLPQLVLAVVGLPIAPESSTLSKVLYIAAILLSFVAQVALNRLAIGSAILVRDAIAEGFIRLPSIVVVFVATIIGLAIIVFLFAAILSAAGIQPLQDPSHPSVPMLAILVTLTLLTIAILQLIFPIAAVETGNPVRMVLRSWQLARRNYLALVGFIVLIFAVLGLLAIAAQFGIGSVIVLALGQPSPGSISALILGLIAGIIQGAFTVVTAVMLARIYLQLSNAAAQSGVPRSGI